MKNKKAQGISVNTIIIALVLLILIGVLVTVFTGRLTYCDIVPKDCICEKYQCYIDQKVKGKLFGVITWYKDTTTIVNCPEEGKYNFLEEDRKECISERPKNPCEKNNPDYILDCELYRIFSKNKSYFNGKGSWLYAPKAFDTHKNDGWVDYWKCEKPICRQKNPCEKGIKGYGYFDMECRALNECEKGNPDYVWDYHPTCYIEDIQEIKEGYRDLGEECNHILKWKNTSLMLEAFNKCGDEVRGHNLTVTKQINATKDCIKQNKVCSKKQ